MRLFLTGLFCILMSSFSFANQNIFELNMSLSIKGQHVSSPKIIVNEGEKAIITQESSTNLKTELEVITKEETTPNGKTGIMMDFTISQFNQDGIKTILSKPKILSIENEQAQIVQGDENGNEILSLTVKV